MDGELAFFRDNGYFVQHAALSTSEVATIVAAMAEEARRHPSEWQISKERRNGRIGAPSVGADAPHLLERTSALDALAYHPNVVPFVRRVLGPGAELSSFTYVHRFPCDIQPPQDLNEGDPRCLTRQWHREYSGTVEGAEANDYFTPALQVIFYLDDVGPDNHCFSVIPESAATKRRLPTAQGSLGLRIDDYGTHGQAGSGSSTAGSYIHSDKPTWVDAYGRELARRVGGADCSL